MRHAMYVYANDEALAARAAPFLREGIERGEAVLAVVDERKAAILRDTVGAGAEHVSHIDSRTVYTRPEAAIRTYDATLRRLVGDGAPAVRAFAETPPSDSPQQELQWMGYEAIVNRALADHPMWEICGYDAREKPWHVLEHGLHTHAHVLTDAWRGSPRYEEPADVMRALTPEPEPLPGLRPVPVDGEARAFRRTLLAEMAAAGLPDDEAQDLLLAASEVLANARRHGGGTPALRIGRVGDRFVCELADHGPGLDDPLAGYVPPAPDQIGGAGLWIARQLTRRLELISSRTGLTARLWA